MKKCLALLSKPAIVSRFAEAKRDTIRLFLPAALIIMLSAFSYRFIFNHYPRFLLPRHNNLEMLWIALESFICGIIIIFFSSFFFARTEGHDDKEGGRKKYKATSGHAKSTGKRV